jgi:dipeptidyl aminopeptidase/acylaminoacyl peptidase
MHAILLPLLTMQGTGAATPANPEQYLLPPRSIREAVTAPWHQNVLPTSISPDGKRFLVLERDGLTSLERLARPHANLGGLDVDLTAGRARNLTTRSAKGLRVVEIETSRPVSIDVPSGARVSDAEWSPDGSTVAFLANFDDRTLLYIADAATGKSRPATRTPLLPTLVSGFEWTKSGHLACILVPEGRSKRPEAPPVATGPRVQTSDTKPNRIRTYASLLQTPQDQAALEYFTTGQIALIDARTGSTATVGKPAMWSRLSPSPDGRFVRATSVQKPFSYLVPISQFGERDVVLDLTGKELVELDKRPLRQGLAEDERKPKDDERRNVDWRPDGAGLQFLQQGPADKDGKRKDRVMLWTAPFGEKDARPIYETDTRITTVRYSAKADTLFLAQTVAGKTRTSAVRLGSDPKPVVLAESKPDDLETPTGSLQLQRDGSVRTSTNGKRAYLAGTKYNKDPMKDGPQPFIDAVDLDTGTKERLFEGRTDQYETAQPLDDDLARLVVTRQSPKQVPDAYLVDRTTKAERAITKNVDYVPDVTQARRETIMVTRPDGVKFRVQATFPAYVSYRGPAFFWFYPNEYKDQETYDKTLRTYNKNAFRQPSPNNKQILIRAGYVVVEPDLPIIGPEGRTNDGYVPQLRNSLTAVIDALASRDWIDRNRLGIGGHSYGAFSTAHAMIATPFFKAGIAGDGNYLRPLTPFGFQSERRQLWEARELYLDMSPLLRAEQLTGALLMYHGLEDQNIGTAPINSERMFTALEALGKPSALIMYPYEDHGQIARETVLDQWARFVDWLDKYVKPEPAK